MNLVLMSTADFYGPVPFEFAWLIEVQSRSDNLFSLASQTFDACRSLQNYPVEKWYEHVMET